MAELATDSRCLSQENDLIGSPLVLSKAMYVANVSDNFSVAAVPVGARCNDFSTDPSFREVITSSVHLYLCTHRFSC